MCMMAHTAHNTMCIAPAAHVRFITAGLDQQLITAVMTQGVTAAGLIGYQVCKVQC